MNNELQKRIFTSITLITGIVFLTFVDPVIFQISLFLIMFICYLEWSKFNINYFKKKNKKNPSKYFLIKLFGGIYLTFVTYSAYHLRGSSSEEAFFFIFILSICACSDVGGYVFGLLISFFCQAGDIFISYFKRLNKVKDTGKILPGHGGFLDRIDGMIVAVPAAYIFENLNFII